MGTEIQQEKKLFLPEKCPQGNNSLIDHCNMREMKLMRRHREL